MKTLVLVFCFLASSAAVAQMSGGGTVLNNEPSMVEFNSHTAHAGQDGMADVQNVMERSAPTMAHGQRPLWEVAPKVEVVPLGDAARMLKKERLTAKKATAVWEN